MGFWSKLCTFALALLQQVPVTQEYLTAPLDHSQRTIAGRSETYAPEIFDAKPPNSNGVENVYHDKFRTNNDCNTANNRSVWCDHRTINTDYEVVELVPNTGKTRYITLIVTSGNQFCGDGYCRDTMLVNGTYPGPLIRGNWGDWFEITVVNKLKNCNGTSIHWHGIRQLNTVWEDGVSGVTQCPIAPGRSQTYRWRATQYGTSWYHSHFSVQYSDGVAGPLIIDGPTSKNYNVDKGPLMLTDWYHDDTFSLYYQEVVPLPSSSFITGTPAVLINGQGRFTQVVNNGTKVMFGCTKGEEHCEPEKASTYRTNINPSQNKDNVAVYKYRIINMSTVMSFAFWIDGHDFWVVATDFVPIVPSKRQFLNVAIGQRYDILIEAKTKANLRDIHPNFWIKMRRCASYCYGDPCPPGEECIYVECRQGILSYDSSSYKTPDFNSAAPKAVSAGCVDPGNGELRPVVVRDLSGEVPASMAFTNPFEVDRRPGSQNSMEAFGGDHGDRKTGASAGEEPLEQTKPYIWDFGSSHANSRDPNGSYVSFMIDWGNATLGLAAAGIPPQTWNPRFVPIVLDSVDKWTVFAIAANWTANNNHVSAGQAVPGQAHPIHLHGHDFAVLAQSSSPFIYGQSYELDLVNPTRRDVVILPAGGYVVIAFKTDNPGTWLMHCHIAWHASAGLALQWVERPSNIPALLDSNPGKKMELAERCHQWLEHEKLKCEWKAGFVGEQLDSGI